MIAFNWFFVPDSGWANILCQHEWKAHLDSEPVHEEGPGTIKRISLFRLDQSSWNVSTFRFWLSTASSYAQPEDFLPVREKRLKIWWNMTSGKLPRFHSRLTLCWEIVIFYFQNECQGASLGWGASESTASARRENVERAHTKCRPSNSFINSKFP